MTGMSGRAAARDAILLAFADIILESGYEKVRVLDVVARSGVARSTFYEHFESREDLLQESVRGPLEALAQLVDPTCDLARVGSMLDHFRQNRALAKSLMANPGTDALVALLSDLIEVGSSTLTLAITARAVAGAQMSIISSWLDGEEPRTAYELAQILQTVSRTLLASLPNRG